MLKDKNNQLSIYSILYNKIPENHTLFIEQKGVRSIVDQEARVGHKSKTNHFFGFKTEGTEGQEFCPTN